MIGAQKKMRSQSVNLCEKELSGSRHNKIDDWMRSFKVSVIIPVYNAGPYVRYAVESAAALDEVGEIILIDDAYPDGALAVCHKLVEEYSQVRLFQHPNGENRGPGASRNLGILNSRYDYIAFLDADDWYLPNRFVKDKEIFNSDDSVDGVYGCTQSFLDSGGVVEPLDEYTTVSAPHASDRLQIGWLTGGTGAFHTNAITVRRRLFDKTGLFDTTLRLHQDSHMYHRFLWYGKIVPGEIVRPIAARRKHSENRITHKNNDSKYQFYRALFQSYEAFDKPRKDVYRKLFNRFIVGTAKTENRYLLFLYRIALILSRPSRIQKLL